MWLDLVKHYNTHFTQYLCIQYIILNIFLNLFKQWNYSGVKAKFSNQLKEAMGDIIDMTNEDVEHLLKEQCAPLPDIEEVMLNFTQTIKIFYVNIYIQGGN